MHEARYTVDENQHNLRAQQTNLRQVKE